MSSMSKLSSMVSRSFDIAFVSCNRAYVERCRTLVRSLYRNGGRRGASGTLSEVLGNGSFRCPCLATHHTILTFHVLHEEHIVVVVEIGSSR